MKKQKLREPKEKEIQKLIIDWLRWQGIFCWKNNSVGIFNKSTGHYIPMGMKGISDITAVLKGGVICCIEVKAKRGKISPFQEEFLENIRKMGGIGFVARCLEDVELSLKDYIL